MIYRTTTQDDIPGITALQKLYHVSTVSEADKPDGFVTTLFTQEQFASIIRQENGIALALDGERVIGYAMAASWHYWSAWPFFQNMIADLPNITYLGTTPDLENSYQYGPICIHRDYRGTTVLPNLFELSRQTMEKRFPILLTFINHINPRSYKAHVDKLGLDVIKNFEYNNNQYYYLGYDTSKPVKMG